MYFTYDSQADAIYVVIREAEGGERGCRQLDEQRIACIDQAGNVFAYELLFVSKGISFEGIDAEDAARIREAIGTAIKSFEPLTVA